MRNKVLRELARLPGFNPTVIFDVGANIGQSAMEFSEHFPSADIVSFEPIPAAFSELEMLATQNDRIRPHMIGLSDRSGVMQMSANEKSTGNKVLVGQRHSGKVIDVPMQTGDSFCESHSIGKVDFLKIDAEGHDLKVVAGFLNMLRDWRIDVVQVECSLSPENDVHVPMAEFTSFLQPLGYRLFGLFGLTRRIHRFPHTRQAMYGDAVYVANPAQLLNI